MELLFITRTKTRQAYLGTAKVNKAWCNKFLSLLKIDTNIINFKI